MKNTIVKNKNLLLSIILVCALFIGGNILNAAPAESDSEEPAAEEGTGGEGSAGGGTSPLQQGLEEFGEASPGLVIDSNLVIYVSTVFRWFLGLVGTVLFLLLAYGGVIYMTAAGNESDTKRAVGIISNAVIGIIILFAAWLVSDYVVSAILAVMEGGGE